MNLNCQLSTQLVDFAAGELAPQDQMEIISHLSGCAECRDKLASHRHFITELQSLPVPEASVDLAQRILAAVREPQPVHFYRRPLWQASAAAAVVLISSLALLYRPHPVAQSPGNTAGVVVNPVSSIDRAVTWLCTHQEANGSWDAQKWGGNRHFEVALTALPALAVIGKHPTTPQRSAVATRAIEWLRAQQSQDGTFGPDNLGKPYNHSIATLALLHAYRLDRDPYLRRQLDAAITAMVRAQNHDGGWAWQAATLSDRTITGWHLAALRLADELGISGVKSALDGGLAWVTAYSAAPANLGLDLSRAYFLTVSPKSAGSTDFTSQLTTLRQRLVQQQILQGTNSGSWSPDIGSEHSGGRIYFTALASLSLAGT
jgi:hypothetical protein